MSKYFKAHQGHRIARAMMNTPVKPIRQCGAWLLWPNNREWMAGFLRVLGGGLLVFLMSLIAILAFGGMQ